MNETWGNLTVLMPSLIMSLVSLCSVCARSCVLRRRGFGEWFAGRVGSYAFKASLLLLASPKSPSLPLTEAFISPYVKSKLYPQFSQCQIDIFGGGGLYTFQVSIDASSHCCHLIIFYVCHWPASFPNRPLKSPYSSTTNRILTVYIVVVIRLQSLCKTLISLIK